MMRHLMACLGVLGLVLAPVSAYPQSPNWKGKIEHEDGVKVIKNPKEPLYGGILLELEEDLCIGNEEDENYLFFKVADVEVDEAGNIYVLDFGNYRIQKFDAVGDYVQTIGQKGQGPGEFEAPTEMKIDYRTGELFVKDNLLVIKRFNNAGEYMDKDIRIVEQLLDFFVDEKKHIWGKFSDPINHYLRKVSFEGIIENEIAEIPYKMGRKIVRQYRVGSTVRTSGLFFTHGYEHDLFIAKIDGQTFVYGHSKGYDLIVVDLETNILRRIQKMESPESFGGSEKDRIKFRIQSGSAAQGHPIGDFELELPEHKPFFYGLLSDDLGRLYARKTPATREYHEVYEYDVFSTQGFYLYRLKIDVSPQIIKGGFLYAHEKNDETGAEFVKRYKIKNWDRLKTGIN